MLTESQKKFIDLFGQKAVERYPKEKVLPSLVICQAIQESGWGTTKTATLANNFHGIKWFNDSICKPYKSINYQTWEEYTVGNITNLECLFCKFDSVDQELDCYYAWLHRTNSPFYAMLHGCVDAMRTFDYIGKSPYATDKKYADNLKRIYNQYPEIKEYDKKALSLRGGIEMQINKYRNLDCKYNHYEGVNPKKYIVIHYIGALGGAEANCEYYYGGNRNASAHYFVGFSGEIWQLFSDDTIAWHCGSSNGYVHPECRNQNSIGIEMCVRKVNTSHLSATDHDWYFEDATVKSTEELVKYLMAKYNIPAERVIRHYDVTGKICPNPYVYNDGKHTWDEFKKAISGTPSSVSTTTSQQSIPTVDTASQKVNTLSGSLKVIYAGSDGINVRTAPSGLDKYVHSVIYNGTYTVVGISADKKWYLLKSGLFISTRTDLVAFTPVISSAQSFDKSIAGTYRTTDNLNLRLNPYVADGNIICEMPCGSKVVNYGYYTMLANVKWYFVSYNGKTGFCSSAYLKK